MADNKPISERDLILPALFCIQKSPNISTSNLIDQLRILLRPQGRDAEKYKNRSDDIFSQKVRNLVSSHKTLEKMGLVSYVRLGKQGYWEITDKGRDILEDNLPLVQYLLQQGFDYNTQQEAFSKAKITQSDNREEEIIYEDAIIENDEIFIEGKTRTTRLKIFERSSKLRDKAIKYFTKDNELSCEVCGFNFYDAYGEQGKGYIEIHHIKPIFSYGDEGIEKTLEEALSNLVPLCSNCHKMIHRSRTQMLTVEELKVLVNQAKHNQ